ncbi:unnamed protein product [Chrysoparadoxa australica]
MAENRATDCRYYAAKRCTAGLTCQFRHHDGAPEMCPVWAMGRWCHGRTCGKAHPANPRAYAAKAAAVTGTPKPCIFFQKGQCNRGATCGFSHDVPAAAAAALARPGLHNGPREALSAPPAGAKASGPGEEKGGSRAAATGRAAEILARHSVTKGIKRSRAELERNSNKEREEEGADGAAVKGSNGREKDNKQGVEGAGAGGREKKDGNSTENQENKPGELEAADGKRPWQDKAKDEVKSSEGANAGPSTSLKGEVEARPEA